MVSKQCSFFNFFIITVPLHIFYNTKLNSKKIKHCYCHEKCKALQRLEEKTKLLFLLFSKKWLLVCTNTVLLVLLYFLQGQAQISEKQPIFCPLQVWHLTTEVGHSVRRRRRRRKETVRLRETELELKRKNFILQGLRFRDIKTCLTTSPR